MKTIREIADEIGVSTQAVYQKIRKLPLSTNLQPYVSRVNNVLTIAVDGVNMIKQAFSSDSCKAKLSTVDNTFTALLSDTIGVLREQLQAKDKQIAELTATMKIQVGSAKRKPPKQKIYTSKNPVTIHTKSAPFVRLFNRAR